MSKPKTAKAPETAAVSAKPPQLSPADRFERFYDVFAHLRTQMYKAQSAVKQAQISLEIEKLKVDHVATKIDRAWRVIGDEAAIDRIISEKFEEGLFLQAVEKCGPWAELVSKGASDKQILERFKKWPEYPDRKSLIRYERGYIQRGQEMSSKGLEFRILESDAYQARVLFQVAGANVIELTRRLLNIPAAQAVAPKMPSSKGKQQAKSNVPEFLLDFKGWLAKVRTAVGDAIKPQVVESNADLFAQYKGGMVWNKAVELLVNQAAARADVQMQQDEPPARPFKVGDRVHVQSRGMGVIKSMKPGALELDILLDGNTRPEPIMGMFVSHPEEAQDPSSQEPVSLDDLGIEATVAELVAANSYDTIRAGKAKRVFSNGIGESYVVMGTATSTKGPDFITLRPVIELVLWEGKTEPQTYADRMAQTPPAKRLEMKYAGVSFTADQDDAWVFQDESVVRVAIPKPGAATAAAPPGAVAASGGKP